jgi:hypothetical protein
MIDSIDIFMFQKLEEKTERINTLWSSNGKSVLKLEEVNPSEIKSALIKDPKILANMQIEEQSVKIQDDIASNANLIKRIEAIQAYKHELVRNEKNAKDFVSKYRPTKADKTITSKRNAKEGLEPATLSTEALADDGLRR